MLGYCVKMAVSRVLLVLGMVALYSTGQAAGQCNTTALYGCLAQFGAYTTAYFSYSVNASNILAACSAYTSTSNCVTSQAMCKVTDTWAILSNWTGASAYYTTICNPSGQTQYLDYQPCYVQPSYETNALACANISNSVSINVNSSAAQQCTTYNSLVACIGSKTAATCNSSAAGQFLTQLIIASYGPLIHLGIPCCTLSGDTTGYVTPTSCQTGPAQKKFSMTGVVLAPVILFALLMVVLILCFVSATRHLGLPCCP